MSLHRGAQPVGVYILGGRLLGGEGGGGGGLFALALSPVQVSGGACSLSSGTCLDKGVFKYTVVKLGLRLFILDTLGLILLILPK